MVAGGAAGAAFAAAEGGVGLMMKALDGGVVVGLSEVWRFVDARGDRLLACVAWPMTCSLLISSAVAKAMAETYCRRRGMMGRRSSSTERIALRSPPLPKSRRVVVVVVATAAETISSSWESMVAAMLRGVERCTAAARIYIQCVQYGVDVEGGLGSRSGLRV